MFWTVLRLVVFLVAAGLTWLVLLIGAVLAAGEVSCYEVCSDTTLWLERAAPWPFVVSVVVSGAVGWLASLLVKAFDRSCD
ncbi:hypothetical protein DSM112329_02852 [Paraconexibacter sp. AEG42_29]|uniref:Transmembrane protein n=1 Tax=Paraconexibacter sp. AEG42_29 TaxID=2997339 RepID=A0AAU7AWL6_9ACTN